MAPQFRERHRPVVEGVHRTVGLTACPPAEDGRRIVDHDHAVPGLPVDGAALRSVVVAIAVFLEAIRRCLAALPETEKGEIIPERVRKQVDSGPAYSPVGEPLPEHGRIGEAQLFHTAGPSIGYPAPLGGAESEALFDCPFGLG